MPHTFDPAVVDAVLGHMNADHNDDNVLIARAFGPFDDIASAAMISFDGDGGDWVAYRSSGAAQPVRVSWPGGAISERPAVRREIVALYDAACAKLGIQPRAHA